MRNGAVPPVDNEDWRVLPWGVSARSPKDLGATIFNFLTLRRHKTDAVAHDARFPEQSASDAPFPMPTENTRKKLSVSDPFTISLTERITSSGCQTFRL